MTETLPISATPMLDAYNALVPPCKVCGEPPSFRLSEIEAFELVELTKDLKENHPGWYGPMMRFEMVCATCMRQLEFADAADRRRIRIDKARQQTYGAGLLPSTARACCYAQSHTNIEAKNYAAWQKAKTETVNLWIQGPPGTGKTYMARCISNAAIDAGNVAAEVTGIRLNDLGGLYAEQREKEITKLGRVHTLVLDDADKAEWTPKGLDALWALFNERHEHKRRIVITANVRPAELRRQMEVSRQLNPATVASIWERMLPMHGIELLGESLRRAQAEPKPEPG